MVGERICWKGYAVSDMLTVEEKRALNIGMEIAYMHRVSHIIQPELSTWLVPSC
jgi:hypothetical protein